MDPIHVLALGKFGLACSEQIRSNAPQTITIPVDPEGRGLPAVAASPESILVVAAGRPVPQLCEQVDELAFTHGLPWLPVVLETSRLRIGPLVVPGVGACHGCFERRRAQHTSTPDVDAALLRHYRESRADAPGGWWPGTPALAAAALSGTLHELTVRAADVAGTVLTWDPVIGAMRSGRVVGCHGCARCGLRRNESQRSSASLYADLAESLAWSA